MAFLRQIRGTDDDAPPVTPPEVRRAVLRRLEEQKIILAGLDAQVDARRPWTAAERRKAPR